MRGSVAAFFLTSPRPALTIATSSPAAGTWRCFMRFYSKWFIPVSIAMAAGLALGHQPLQPVGPGQAGITGGKGGVGGQKDGKSVGIQAKATPAERIKLAKDFKIELLYSVPREQGSWVSMCVDGQNRLIVSDQGGAGLFRVTPSPVGSGAAEPKIEEIPARISGAQVSRYACDGLHVVVIGG